MNSSLLVLVVLEQKCCGHPLRPCSELLAFFFTQAGLCSSAKSIQLLLHSSATSETWPANFFTRQREQKRSSDVGAYLSYWLESKTVWVYTHLYSTENTFDSIGGAVSEAKCDPDRTNKNSSERKSSCHQSLLFVWTEIQSQVDISVSFLPLVQEKPGGSETQITVIKKNIAEDYGRNTSMCHCVQLRKLCKKTRGPTISWPEANDRVEGVVLEKSILIFWWLDFGTICDW